MTALSAEELLHAYRVALTIRRFDGRCVDLAREGRLPGPVHPALGEEVIAAAAAVVRRDGDTIVSYHRGHGHCIAAGADVRRMMAEIMGRVDGYCRGKGGSMHICDIERGLFGTNGIVGGGISVAGGAALAADLAGDGRVVFCFFSDGASNQGIFHETANLAAIWSLPLVFVCENNGYALSVPVSESTAVADISQRAQAYGFPGATVDGVDFESVHAALREATERARRGGGPSLVEAKVAPWDAHSTVSGQHKFDDEHPSWRDVDGLPRLRELALAAGAPAVEAVEREVEAAVDAAVAFAEASPEPEIEEVAEHVYA